MILKYFSKITKIPTSQYFSVIFVQLPLKYQFSQQLGPIYLKEDASTSNEEYVYEHASEE